jgi:hypothetical protein
MLPCPIRSHFARDRGIPVWKQEEEFPYNGQPGIKVLENVKPGKRDVELLNRREIEARRGVTAQIRKDSGGYSCRSSDGEKK